MRHPEVYRVTNWFGISNAIIRLIILLVYCWGFFTHVSVLCGCEHKIWNSIRTITQAENRKSSPDAWTEESSVLGMHPNRIFIFSSGFYYDQIKQHQNLLRRNSLLAFDGRLLVRLCFGSTNVRVHGIDMVDDIWSGFSSALIIERIFKLCLSHSFELKSIQLLCKMSYCKVLRADWGRANVSRDSVILHINHIRFVHAEILHLPLKRKFADQFTCNFVINIKISTKIIVNYRLFKKKRKKETFPSSVYDRGV